jgi:NitT/TauT family transport system permease protein
MPKSKKNKIKKLVYQLLATGFWVLLWEIASRKIDNEILLASPLQVLQTIGSQGRTLAFWQTIAFSSLHIILGFFMAVLIGSILAILSYWIGLFRELLSPLIKVVNATPVASFIILFLFWFNSANLSTYISFLMVMPIVYLNILQGLKSADEKLLQMAKVFRLSFFKKLRAIYLPAVIPYLIAAVSIGLGFAFKSGIAAEVIGIPAKSIGRRLYEAKLNLMTKEMLAWTVVIILISVIFEKAVLFVIRLLQHKGSKAEENKDAGESKYWNKGIRI